MKQNPTIYKIDNSYSLENVQDGILKHLTINAKAYKERDVYLKEYNSKLIVIESDEKDSEWSGFFPQEYVDDISLEYKMPSLVLLITTNSGVFAIVGGAFYKYILPFLNVSYGLNTYSRIMDPVSDQIISISTRGVTGLRAGMQEQFKDNYRIMDYIRFGKIPTEIKIKLSNHQAELFFSQFITNRSPQIILNISTGFNLNKKLSYNELGSLIEILEYLETQTANDFFSSYKEIVDKSLISSSLKPGLINKLYNIRKNIIDGKVSDFDLCYPNKIEDFYSADEYEIKLKKDQHKFDIIGRTSDKSEIIQIILKYLSDNNLDSNLASFSNVVYNIYILTYKNQKLILRTALIYHLNTELYLSGQGTFIYLDSKWYKLREIFIDEMNTRCSEILINNNLNNSILDEKWQLNSTGKRENEGTYNDKYLKENYLVLDRIIVDSIELADVIHIKDDTLFLCHVKYGFSTDMRELYSQIISSARRLKNDLKDEKNDYLNKIFLQLEAKERNGGLNNEEFIELFNRGKIKYVMAITSHLANRDLLTDIHHYSSNIAKLSLIQCFTEMRTEYYDLEIEIINNEECF
jgi:uncharacterized protein (TIGR04141 family)